MPGRGWGAALQATNLPYGVVCAPGQRYHPAIIAQAAATLAEMFPGRFWIAVGSGQFLNEAITGDGRPPKSERNSRLLECVGIMRALWAGQTVTHRGSVRVEEARLYTLPPRPPLLLGAAITPETAEWIGGWAVWLIFLPGLASGIVIVAGIAALVGSALAILVPGAQAFFSVGIILVSAVLVVSGRYKQLEKVTAFMALVLILYTVATAIAVFPGWSSYAHGLVPVLPEDFDAYFVLPWFGFLLAGAAGMMWYSYWVAARGYGGPVFEEEDRGDQPVAEADSNADKHGRLRSWMLITGTTAAIGVAGATVVNLSFLTLGAELLGPLKIIPQGIRVAEDIARLLSEVWGPAGAWVLLSGIFVALWGSILANQDGWGRMYADATLMLLGRTEAMDPSLPRKRLLLRNGYIIAVLAAAPIIVYLLLRDPCPQAAP